MKMRQSRNDCRIQKLQPGSLATSGRVLQIGDDIGNLIVLLQTGKGHLGAGNAGARIEQELVEVLNIPLLATQGLHGRRRTSRFGYPEPL